MTVLNEQITILRLTLYRNKNYVHSIEFIFNDNAVLIYLCSVSQNVNTAWIYIERSCI